MTKKLLVTSALVAAVSALTCDLGQYASPNTGRCMLSAGTGEYCNVVRTCMSGNSCDSNVCVASPNASPKYNFAALGEACDAMSCVPGLKCGSSSMMCETMFGAAGNGDYVVLEVTVTSESKPIMIPFGTIGEAAALEGVRTFMWGKKSNTQWEGRLAFQNSNLLANHLAIHAKDYYVGEGVDLEINVRTYGGETGDAIGDDVRGMFTSLNWASRELWSTGFAEHPNEPAGSVRSEPKSCVNGNIQADLEFEPDWNVWKAGWVDLIPPALARNDIHAYHYGFDEENHIINYFECYSGRGANGMEEDAADVLERGVHCCAGSFISRLTFGQTNGLTSATFAMYGAYIPDDVVFHNGPSAGYIINPNFLVYNL
jgi:hypothetical protein